MPGTVSTPSGDIIARANTEGEDVYNCSHCKEVIPLPPNQKIQSIRRLNQTHLEQCMPPSSLQDNLSNLPPVPRRFPPLAELCMPLQPRRTWSAEDERRRRLEEDPDAYDVGPHTVTCAGCHRPIRLNATGRYYAANWNKHKMGCKNTNAVNGASAMSAESKFTGRVAAFRVAKPAENSEPFGLSSASGAPTAQKLDHSLVQAHGLSYAPLAESYDQSPAREHMRSWTDQLASRELSAVGYYVPTHTSRPNQRTTAGIGPTYDQPFAESHDTFSYTHAQSNASRALDSDGPESSPRLCIRKPSRTQTQSPNGPSPRLGEHEAYGPAHSPFGVEYERYDQSPHAVASFAPQRTREDLTRSLRHSDDAFRKTALLPAPEALPGLQRILDKGKSRRIEPSDSGSFHILQHSSSRKRAYSRPEMHRRDVSGRHARIYDRAAIPGPRSSQEEASRSGNQTSRARIFGEIGVVSDLGSNSAASSPELNAALPSKSMSASKPIPLGSRSQVHGYFDERALPPLSSLTFTKSATAIAYPEAISEMSHRRRSRSKERHTSSSFSDDLDRSPVWRERTRAWVQTGTASSASGRDSPESVVLPPIRTASNPLRTSPSGTRRRQREGDEHDGNYMDECKPSPPKVFVLHIDPSHPSSTLRTDDLSFKYKHTCVSSVEATDVGGDPKEAPLVGNQSEVSTNPVKDVRVNAARLHPVWKWEQKEDVSLPQSSGAAKDGDVVMNAPNIS